MTDPVLQSQEWQHLQQEEDQNRMILDRAIAMMVRSCMDSSSRDLKGNMTAQGRFFVYVGVLQVHFLFRFRLPRPGLHDLALPLVLDRRSCPCPV